MTKLLVSDYDDTFYLNDEDINNNISLIKKHQNKLRFIIATGRSYYDFIVKKNKYNIECEYIILNHGASIIKNDEIIYNEVIDNKIKKELLNDLDINKSVRVFGCSKKESRLNIEIDNLTKIYIKYSNMKYASKIYQKIINKYQDYLNCFLVSHDSAIEVVSKLASKKNAILKILEIENIDKDNVYTIGNGDTDYEMLDYFNGYAMENSSAKVSQMNLQKVKSVSILIESLVN